MPGYDHAEDASARADALEDVMQPFDARHHAEEEQQREQREQREQEEQRGQEQKDQRGQEQEVEPALVIVPPFAQLLASVAELVRVWRG